MFKRIMFVAALCGALALVMAMPAVAYTPRRGIQGGRPGDMELVNASWWSNGSMHGEGRGFVPTVGRSTADVRFSRTRGWVIGLEAPNVAEGADMSAREAAIALHTIRVRLPYARLVSPTFRGTCEAGSYNYSLTDVVMEYRRLYGEAPWFDAIGIQTAAPTAAESICWIERVLAEARGLGYDVGLDVEIWVVGFSSWPSASAEGKERYLQEMLAYFSTESQVMRYSWRPMRRIEQGIWYDYDDLKLVGDDGQLTSLGRIYVGGQ